MTKNGATYTTGGRPMGQIVFLSRDTNHNTIAKKNFDMRQRGMFLVLNHSLSFVGNVLLYLLTLLGVNIR